MPPERLPPDDPREWLNRARGNLVRAKTAIPGVYLEDLCFDAQQAAEKALKALLIQRGVPFPYVHDLGELLTLLHEEGETVPEQVKEAGRLTRFAVATRYPGIAEPVSQEEYQEVVAIAERVVRWVAKLMGQTTQKDE